MTKNALNEPRTKLKDIAGNWCYKAMIYAQIILFDAAVYL